MAGSNLNRCAGWNRFIINILISAQFSDGKRKSWSRIMHGNVFLETLRLCAVI